MSRLRKVIRTTICVLLVLLTPIIGACNKETSETPDSTDTT